VAVHKGKPARGLAVHDGAMEARLVLVDLSELAELLAGRPLFFSKPRRTPFLSARKNARKYP
jgi:hypothetical protein